MIHSKLWTSLTIYQHSLNFGIMSSMLETLFSQLNLKLSKGCLSKRMSDIFVKIEHEMTGMDNVCTGFKFQQA